MAAMDESIREVFVNAMSLLSEDSEISGEISPCPQCGWPNKVEVEAGAYIPQLFGST
jgi:hypothetical protein